MTPPIRIVPHWDAAQSRGFMRETITFAHRFLETGLFQDGALEALLDAYPADAIDINLYDYDEADQVRLRTGARDGVSGAELLAAVRSGRLWLNCRHIMQTSAPIGAHMRQAMADISAHRPDFKPVKVWGQLIISSPKARVPFHADPSGVILFHLRGRKRIFIYPADEAHAPARELEKIVAQQQTEELTYSRAMDAAAQVFDLEPGQAVTWPLYAPHRVDNLDGLCVSLSVDYLTRAQQALNGAHFTNLALRQLGFAPPAPQTMAPIMRSAFWLASGGLKRLGLLKERLSTLPRDFRPEAGEADGARALA